MNRGEKTFSVSRSLYHLSGRISHVLSVPSGGEENTELQLHTAPLSFSSASFFFPKRFSVNFLHQLTHISSLSLPQHLTIEPRNVLDFGGDILFTIWLNQVPQVWTVPPKRPGNSERGIGLIQINVDCHADSSSMRDRESLEEEDEIIVEFLSNYLNSFLC
jgi:hypothetical protein